MGGTADGGLPLSALGVLYLKPCMWVRSIRYRFWVVPKGQIGIIWAGGDLWTPHHQQWVPKASL